MRRCRAAGVMAFLLLASVAGGRQGQILKESALPERYRDWLKIVSYIIVPAEREVFMKLTADRDRDIFIESFWKLRDPTPATPQNEYKDEHLRRFQYANTRLHRGTPREGWMTDMGRVYITLGEPMSIERFDGSPGIYPCQVWYYYGDKTKSLPTYFGLLFYQRGGGGEYKLYNPAADGPSSLLIDTRKIDSMDPSAAYEQIKKLAPTLAGPAISIIPSEIPFGFRPSPQSSIILAQIFESPRKDINPSYATHFMNYKGIVSTDYLTNYIESDVTAAVIEDPALGLNFLHFAISPKKISADYFQPRDEYYCNFKLNVSLRRGTAVVFQYDRDYPFYFPPDKLGSIQGKGVSVFDAFPIADGTYQLTVLLQNAVGKEFSIFEKEFVIPAAGGPIRVSTPVLGYKLQADPAAVHAPFKVLGQQILVDAKGTVGTGEDLAFLVELANVPAELWKDGVLEVTIEGAQAKGRAVQTVGLKLADRPFRTTMALLGSFPAGSLRPDYYEVSFVLKDGSGAALGRASAPVVVSTADIVAHPVSLVRTVPADNSFLYFYGLAYQYEQIGNPSKAEDLFRKAHEMRPEYEDGLFNYADFLIKIGKYDESLKLIEEFKAKEKFRFQYFLLQGRALMGRGDFGPAIASLLEGNKIYNSDTRLLNALGFCYYKTGKKKEALDVLAASLRLNTEQSDARELMARVEKELK